jgi:hypothetical protein
VARQETLDEDVEAAIALLNEELGFASKTLTWEKLAEKRRRAKQGIQERWKGKGIECLIEAALQRMMNPERFTSFNELPGLIEDLAKSEQLVKDIKELARYDYELVKNDPAFSATLVLLGGQPDMRMRRSLGSLYRKLDDEKLVPLFDKLLEIWGRKMVAPRTTADLALYFTALVEGLALRGRVDERVQPDHMQDGVLSLLLVMTQPVDDDADLDERFFPINDFNENKKG